jgi:hypothetical protein
VRIVTETREEAQHALIEHRVAGNGRVEGLEFGSSWQFAIEQEVGHLDEVGLLCELLDGIATVHQQAFLAVDERDFAFTTAGGYETRIVGEDTLVGVKPADFDDVRTRRSLAYREVHGLAVRAGQRECVFAHVSLEAVPAADRRNSIRRVWPGAQRLPRPQRWRPRACPRRGRIAHCFLRGREAPRRADRVR